MVTTLDLSLGDVENIFATTTYFPLLQVSYNAMVNESAYSVDFDYVVADEYISRSFTLLTASSLMRRSTAFQKSDLCLPDL